MRINVTRFRQLYRKIIHDFIEYLQTTEPHTVRYDAITYIVKISMSLYASRNSVFSSSNTGSSIRQFTSLKGPGLVLEPTQPHIQWMPGFFPENNVTGA